METKINFLFTLKGNNMNKKFIKTNSNNIFGNKNNKSLFLKKFLTKIKTTNDIQSQYSILIDETIVLSKKEENPEKQLITFFLQRAKKIYNISKNKSRIKNSSAYINLLNNDNNYELSQVINILDNGIKVNVFHNCDTYLTGKAMINAIKGFDFLIYQGKSFIELNYEIQEIVRIFLNSIKK